MNNSIKEDLDFLKLYLEEKIPEELMLLDKEFSIKSPRRISNIKKLVEESRKIAKRIQEYTEAQNGN